MGRYSVQIGEIRGLHLSGVRVARRQTVAILIIFVVVGNRGVFGLDGELFLVLHMLLKTVMIVVMVRSSGATRDVCVLGAEWSGRVRVRGGGRCVVGRGGVAGKANGRGGRIRIRVR